MNEVYALLRDERGKAQQLVSEHALVGAQHGENFPGMFALEKSTHYDEGLFAYRLRNRSHSLSGKPAVVGVEIRKRDGFHRWMEDTTPEGHTGTLRNDLLSTLRMLPACRSGSLRHKISLLGAFQTSTGSLWAHMIVRHVIEGGRGERILLYHGDAETFGAHVFGWHADLRLVSEVLVLKTNCESELPELVNGVTHRWL